MQRITGLIITLSLSFFVAQAQQPQYPKGYFRWPVNLKPDIVANLGELRPNHWHMGLDVRTDAKVNQQVFAAASGYIAFIGIRPLSFGRFIIINHPNGLSTLYGHLNDFAPTIEKYVTDQQYGKESWAVELELRPDQFPVNKGSFIAYSGSTGGSQGPHVHFEIRDTKSNECLNPLLFGFPLVDDVPPSIVKLALYDRTTSTYSGIPRFFPTKKKGEEYLVTSGSTIRTGAAACSFGIQAFDRRTGTSNQDGIYSAKLFVDNVQVIEYIIDSIGYDKTNYLNAHIDFTLKYNGGAYIQHLSSLPGEHSGVYHPTGASGVVGLPDTSVHAIRIEVRDAYQNLSVLRFGIQFDPGLTKPRPFVASAKPFVPNVANEIVKPDFELKMPATCIYDTIPSFYFRSEPVVPNAVSAMHQVNESTIPVQGSFQVRIKNNRPLQDGWRNKVVIERTFRTSQVRKAEFDGEWFNASFNEFGYFRAFTDLQAPEINNLGNADTVDLSPAKSITFRPTDNYSVKGFRAELDGQWLRFTNDKGRIWIYNFDERCPDGIHQLTVTVEDLVGNTTTRSWWFKKYPYTAPRKKAGTKKKGTKKTTSAKKKSTKKR